MGHIAIPTRSASDFALAYVNDAHNVGCIVRLVGDTATHCAHYSPDIQQHGVVVRTCHMVIVDHSHDPFEVVWRIGTVGAAEDAGDGQITVSLGYRTLKENSRPKASGLWPVLLGLRCRTRVLTAARYGALSGRPGASTAPLSPERLGPGRPLA
jgi:hypothetical protein